MKETGVVRRIDELGRIVVPKEIRKTLRIREGDALEIFTQGDAIILKKYSSVSKFSELTQELVIAIEEVTRCVAIVFDTDNIVAVSSKRYLKYIQTKLSSDAMAVLTSRRPYNKDRRTFSGKIDILFGDEEIAGISIIPLVVGGDVYGGIALLSRENFIENEKQLVLKSGAIFLCKGLE